VSIFNWIFGKKDSSPSDDIDAKKIISEGNKEAWKMFHDFEKANKEGNSKEVQQRYMDKHELTEQDLNSGESSLDDETSELLDNLMLEYAETSRNQQMLRLTDRQRDKMVESKNDLAHQLKICKRAMAKGSILPFPFERAVILLMKANRFDEALELCAYTAWWCGSAHDGYDGWSHKHFESPLLQKIVARIPKIRKKLQ
jgi:hypothetical protein